MQAVWIIDDDRSIRWVFEKALTRANIPHRTFSNAVQARAALDAETPALIVCDIRMPGESGLDFLQSVREALPRLPVIIMTAHSDLDSAVNAFQQGAFEYLPKPFDINATIELIQRTLNENEPPQLSGQVQDAVPEILGQAPAMQEVFRAIGRLAQSHVTVLINGESGTGKELVASALHRHSPRASRPFITINTAAIPADLLESELFGHERGAFTGAQSLRQGRFEQAHGGTLFLDEIGDMPAALQTRLLRVLSDGRFYRVGGHSPVHVDVRIIAATHQDLETRVHEGLFREDLFYRLNVIRLHLPALRERREDIPLLAKHFLQKSALELNIEPKTLTVELATYLTTLPFPGNVRELENLCRYLTVMAPGQKLTLSDMPQNLREQRQETITGEIPWQRSLANLAHEQLTKGERDIFPALSRDLEKTLIETALRYTQGRKIEAAQLLGLGRNTLTRKIQELHIRNGEDHSED
ncbi:MAG: nitrogen regulation protein NR(I) [Pseudomonadota bacterium]|nr:nitrogen regulation protein NR(I) [Pseudomonadota bacterium]